MSTLGDVLELIYAGPDAAVTVHATIDERRDEAVARRVADAAHADRARVQDMPFMIRVMIVPAIALAFGRSLGERLRRSPALPSPGPESQLQIWVDATGRARIERSWEGPDGHEELTTITATGRTAAGPFGDGPSDPAWSPIGRPLRWPLPTAIDAERHFDHGLLRQIVAALELRAPRDDEVAGRPVVVADATRRRPEALWPQWLPFGAEGYELAFDCEHGDLLAYRAQADGAAYESATVTGITYGEPIDPDLLTSQERHGPH
jgi:hypothetical protein